jgi:2-O-methyltransferase
MRTQTIYQLVMMNPMYRFLRKRTLVNLLLKVLEAKGFLQRSISKKEIENLIGNEDVVIVEVGASTGTDTAEFLTTFKRGKVFCFEPDPRALIKFESTINDVRCELYKLALSDQIGEIDFNQSEGNSNKRYIGSSSLKKPYKVLDLWPEIKFTKVIKVQTITLDSWVKERKIGFIDFVWADVQGAEKELIIGGRETFFKKVKYFYTEFSNNELYKDQPTLNEILDLLPSYVVIKIFASNVLLKNTSIPNSEVK